MWLILGSLVLAGCAEENEPADAAGGATSGGTGGASAGTGSQAGTGGGGAQPGGGATGTNTGGTSTGGASTGGTSGEAGSAGENPGTGGTTVVVEGGEFALALPRDPQVFGPGPKIAATPSGTVIIAGPSAPPAVFPDAGAVPYVIEVSSTGEIVQARAFADGITPEAIAVDSTGALVMLGQLFRDASFGGPTLAAVTNGYYVAKLDSDFEFLTQTRVETVPSVYADVLAVDANDDIYVGMSQRLSEEQWIEGPSVAKFTSAGDPSWTVTFQNTESGGYPNDFAFNAGGELLAIGSFNGTLTIGSDVLDTQATGSGYRMYNGWLAWLSVQSGAPRTALRFGGPIFDLGYSVDLTSSGGLRLLTLLSGAATVGGRPGSYEEAEGQAVVVNLDAAGAAQWIAPLGGPELAARAAALGFDDQTYAAGSIERTVGMETVSSAMVMRVNADGSLGERRTYETLDPNGADGIAVDRLGGVWIVGSAVGQVAIGGSALDFGADGGLFVIRHNPF